MKDEPRTEEAANSGADIPQEEPNELSISDMEQVSGGTDPTPVSNIMKTKHDTVKNTISNIH